MSYAVWHYIGYRDAIDYELASGWINPARMADEVIDAMTEAGLIDPDIQVNTEEDEIIITYDAGEDDYFELITDGSMVIFTDTTMLQGWFMRDKPYTIDTFKARMKLWKS